MSAVFVFRFSRLLLISLLFLSDVLEKKNRRLLGIPKC